MVTMALYPFGRLAVIVVQPSDGVLRVAESGRVAWGMPRSLASVSSMAHLACSFGSAVRTEVSKGSRCWFTSWMLAMVT